MEEFFKEQVQLDEARVTITLSHSGVLRWHGDREGVLVVQDDLIGFSKGVSSIELHTFKFCTSKWCGRSPGGRIRKDILVKFSNEGSHKLWCDNIQRFLDGSGRPKRLLVFVNPFGGGGVGKKVFKQSVEPLLKSAGITFTMRETQFQRHAKDLAKSFDLSLFDGIICVSGDGVLVEVLNGLLERADWERAIKLPLGIVPAGTGNGMAKSVLAHAGEPCDAMSATFVIIRGLVADVDFESERFRWMGSLRLDVQTLIRIVNLRRYMGSFAYIPAPGSEGTGGPYSSELEVKALLQNTDADSERSWRKNGYSGPLSVPSQAEWRAMDGAFILVWLHNVPYAGEHVLSAPLAKFSDGFLDLIIIRDCPRLSLLRLLLKIQTGSHIKSKYVQYLKVKAFRLAPGGRYASDTQGGYVDLDGEVLARGHGSMGDGSTDPMVYGPTIDVSVERGLATVFCPS